MPNYDYRCESCEHQEEVFQKMTDDVLTKCPQCQCSTFKRGPGGGIALQFKGTGFYITDYATKDASQDNHSSSTDFKASGPCGCNKPSCDA